MRKPKDDDLITFEFSGTAEMSLSEFFHQVPEDVTPEMIKEFLLDECRTILCFLRDWNFAEDLHMTVLLQNPHYVPGTPPLFDREQPAPFVSAEVW